MSVLEQKFNQSIEPKITGFYTNLYSVESSEGIVTVLTESGILDSDIKTNIISDTEVIVNNISDINSFVRKIENTFYRVYFTIKAINKSSISISLK